MSVSVNRSKAHLSSARSTGLEASNFMPCKCCLVVKSWGHAGGETSWVLLEESLRSLAGFPLSRPTGELLCCTDADRASDKTSRRSMSGCVVTLGGGVLNCWAKKQKSVALSSWESELLAATTSGTRSLGIQSELMDLGYSCSVTVATDSQSVVDHSKRRGHSVASKHVGLRGLWLQEALVDGKLELERVDTAMNPANVCTKSLPGNSVRELCRLPRTKESWVTIPTSGT